LLTLLDRRGLIPAFIHISNGKIQEVNMLNVLALESGAFYIVDRVYVDFTRLFQMQQGVAFFVSRWP
jgi:hypothetical protein